MEKSKQDCALINYFKDRVKTLRTEMKLTQNEFAKLVEVNHPTVVANWEAGRMFPGPDKLEKIAEVCGEPIYSLFLAPDEVIVLSRKGHLTLLESKKNGETPQKKMRRPKSLKKSLGAISREQITRKVVNGRW